MSNIECREDGCTNSVHCKGLCQNHYRQAARRERGLKSPGAKRDPSKPYSKYNPTAKRAYAEYKAVPPRKRIKLVLGQPCPLCEDQHILTKDNTYEYGPDTKNPGRLVCKLRRIKSIRKYQGYSGNIEDPLQPHNRDKIRCPKGHEYDIAKADGSRGCSICQEVTRFKMRANKYGMTSEQLQQLIEESGDECAICHKTSEASLHVDHDHETGRVRGLLCNNCNPGLGKFKHDIKLLQSAIEYLEKSPIRFGEM